MLPFAQPRQSQQPHRHTWSHHGRGRPFAPPMKLPESLASFIAISAAVAIFGASDSIGPVKPSRTPILDICRHGWRSEHAGCKHRHCNLFHCFLPKQKFRMFKIWLTCETKTSLNAACNGGFDHPGQHRQHRLQSRINQPWYDRKCFIKLFTGAKKSRNLRRKQGWHDSWPQANQDCAHGCPAHNPKSAEKSRAGGLECLLPPQRPVRR